MSKTIYADKLMDEEQRNVFKEYREVKDQIAALEERRKELELLVMDEIDENGGKFVTTKFGEFWSMSRKSWAYSPAVDALAENLKQMKKKEEHDGTAVLNKVSGYVRLVIPKEGDK